MEIIAPTSNTMATSTIRSSCSLTFSMLGVSGGLSARLVRVRVNIVGAPQRKPGGEHRKKSQRARGQRHAVAQRDHAEQQELIEDDRVATPGAQESHTARQRRTHEEADAQTPGDTPHQVDGDPAPPHPAEIVQPHRAET